MVRSFKNKGKSGDKPRDFEKSKYKVGKAKAGAVNATDLSFKTKKIVVKEQDVCIQDKVNRVAKSTNSTNIIPILTRMSPFLVNTGHYSAGSRKDAFISIIRLLKEVLPTHGKVLDQSGRSTDDKRELLKPYETYLDDALGTLVAHSGKGIVDREFSVRSAALQLLATLMDCAISSFISKPLLPLILLALSHIDPGVRKDGLNALNLVYATYSHQLLPSTIEVLNALKACHDSNFHSGISNVKLSKNSMSKKPSEMALSIFKLYRMASNEFADKQVSVPVYIWGTSYFSASANRKKDGISEVVDETLVSEKMSDFCHSGESVPGSTHKSLATLLIRKRPASDLRHLADISVSQFCNAVFWVSNELLIPLWLMSKESQFGISGCKRGFINIPKTAKAVDPRAVDRQFKEILTEIFEFGKAAGLDAKSILKTNSALPSQLCTCPYVLRVLDSF